MPSNVGHCRSQAARGAGIVSCLLAGRSLFHYVIASLLLVAPAVGQSLPEKVARWLTPQQWTKQRNKPVVSLGKTGDFDDTHIFAPFVGKEGGHYFLWYPGSHGAVADRVFRLGLATSKNGVEFQKTTDNPVLEVDRKSVV